MKPHHRTLIKSAFGLTAVYWLYLAFVGQMVIVQDALGYEHLGQLIYHNGWTSYFKTGPNREPIYPMMIALSMKIEDIIAISYQDVLKFLQVFILFISQITIYRILKRLKIHAFISTAVILFFGFSPDVVNSAISLFSEIAVYPFVLAIILLSVRWWQSIGKTNSHTFRYALLTGLTLFGATLVKGVFQLITMFYVLPYLILTIIFLRQKNKDLFIRIMTSLLIFGAAYHIPIHGFKSLNKMHNSQYVLTNRGTEMFYGNTVRNMEEFSLKRVFVALTCATSVGEKKVCHRLFGAEACSFWDFRVSFDLGTKKRFELEKNNIPRGQANHMLVSLALKEISRNPVQFFVFYGAEALSMIFWKSAEIGFAEYPNWLSTIFANDVFRYTLSFFTSILTLVSLIYLIRYIWRNKKSIFDMNKKTDESKILLFFILLIILLYVGSFALVAVLTRFTLPIVPLFLIMIAFFAQNIFFRNGIGA